MQLEWQSATLRTPQCDRNVYPRQGYVLCSSSAYPFINAMMFLKADVLLTRQLANPSAQFQ